MKRNIFWLISSLIIFAALPFVWNPTIGLSQIMPANDIYMFGTIGNDKRMSGYFGKNHQNFKNKNWCVFIGANGKVYKLTLTNRSVHELYIDGQKIADGEIGKHTAEYKPFLEKFWRSEEIEKESRELEQKIKPLDRQIETVSKEIEQLDRAEEKLDRDEKKSAGFAETRKNINEQQKRLAEIQRNFDEQIEALSNRQEKLSDEQESLKLMDELDKVLLQISADLKSLGVIKNSNNLTFKLSNVELIVNGKQVASEVFESLKNKYIVEQTGESGFLFRWKGNI